MWRTHVRAIQKEKNPSSWSIFSKYCHKLKEFYLQDKPEGRLSEVPSNYLDFTRRKSVNELIMTESNPYPI